MSICHGAGAFENLLASISNRNITGTELSPFQPGHLTSPLRRVPRSCDHANRTLECDVGICARPGRNVILPNSGATQPAPSERRIQCLTKGISLSRPLPCPCAYRAPHSEPHATGGAALAYLIRAPNPLFPRRLLDKRAHLDSARDNDADDSDRRGRGARPLLMVMLTGALAPRLARLDPVADGVIHTQRLALGLARSAGRAGQWWR